MMCDFRYSMQYDMLCEMSCHDTYWGERDYSQPQWRGGRIFHIFCIQDINGLSCDTWYMFFSPSCFLALLSRSLPVVAQTRGRIAGPPPPSPLRYVPSLLSREESSVFFPRRLASNCLFMSLVIILSIVWVPEVNA